MDAFLIERARRYDVKGKTYFNYPNKYYYTDLGLRNARLNYRQYDPGHIMENIIYNEKKDAELRSLKLTGDFFKKIVIRMDIPHNYYGDNGFFHCNLIVFLLHDVELF